MSKGRGGYPTDEAEIRGYIKRLYEAFHNVDDIVDKPCKNGNMAQAAQKINDGFYPAKAVERACWDLFVSFITLVDFCLTGLPLHAIEQMLTMNPGEVQRRTNGSSSDSIIP